MVEKFAWAVVLLSAFSALGGATWLKRGAVPPRTPAEVFLNLVLDVLVVVVGVWILGGANG